MSSWTLGLNVFVYKWWRQREKSINSCSHSPFSSGPVSPEIPADDCLTTTPPPPFLPLISCPRWSAVPQPSCTVPDPKSGSGDPHAAAQLLRVRICRNEEHLCRNAVKCAFICDLCETSEANFLHSARLSASPQLCGYAPLHLGLQECAHVSLFIIVSY